MDGAGTDNDEEPIAILTMQNSADRLSGIDHQNRSLIADRQLGFYSAG